MDQRTGEQKIKSLQKEFLLWVEEHPLLSYLSADDFDLLRRRVFRGTFQAFRLGIIGVEGPTNKLRDYFFYWLGNAYRDQEEDVAMECFRTSLEAFRIGALVSAHKRKETNAEVYDR